jgi:UDP-GlcNAc:undecaprenyl-phosphate GlcNAc-1-phosphate transferase
MVPVYMPLLLPLTLIAIPAADLVLAIVRRTWKGQSPFAADRGHLHHRLLEIGHSHSRAVLIMYFWSAVIAFGTVGFSARSSSMWILLTVVGLSAVGLVVLLLPRFRPNTPRWAEAFVPPRYRQSRRRARASAEAAVGEAGEAGEAAVGEPAAAQSAAAHALHGATAIGDRSHLPERRRVPSAR